MRKVKLGILNYGIGNLGSIANMAMKAGAEPILLSDDKGFDSCDKYILPGVGAFASAMQLLKTSPIYDALLSLNAKSSKPLLGICLGMQMLFESSEEGGTHNGLRFIPGKVVRFNSIDKFEANLPVPHMGWSAVRVCRDNVLFNELHENRFYHVHSYHVITQEEYAIGTSTYGYDYVSAVKSSNVFGVQFHPEKSHRYGLQMMKNFIELA